MNSDDADPHSLIVMDLDWEIDSRNWGSSSFFAKFAIFVII